MLVQCGRGQRRGATGGERLAADRFWRRDEGSWIDLATGRPVALAGLPAAEAATESRWIDRCTALANLWHPHLLPIVDFGSVGTGRFEAWAVSRPWRRPRDRAVACALRAAVGFLHACGLSAGRPGWRRLGESDGRPVLVPDAATGRAIEAEERAAAERETQAWAEWLDGWPDPPGARIVGVRLQPRRAERWILDVLDEAAPGGPRVVRLCAGPGAGVTTLLQSVAREARRRGFVPLEASLAYTAPEALEGLAGRHVLIIERDSAGAAASAVLTLGLRSARGHVVVIVERSSRPADRTSPGAGEAIALDPLPIEALVEMPTVYPPGLVDRARLQRAAVEAAGWPGLFVARLVASRVPARLRQPAVWLVRETRAAYAAGPAASARAEGLLSRSLETEGGAASFDLDAAGRRAGEATALETRVAAARALADRGRHALALRQLRAALRHDERRKLGGAARAEAVLGLAAVLAARGRAGEALEWLIRVAEDGPMATRLCVGVAIAELRIDEAQLTEGEAAARAARLASERGGIPGEAAAAALALARSLYWQQRYDEAAEALPCAEALPVAARARCHAWHARVALARGDWSAAGRAAAAAIEAARQSGDGSSEACARRAQAAVAAAMGDAAAFREAIAAARLAARRVHRPLGVLRAELAYAEGCARLGLAHEREPARQRLARWRCPLPGLFRLRLDHLLAGAGAPCEADRASAGATSPVFVEVADRSLPSVGELRDLSELLRICHDVADDVEALGAVCARLRDRLRALAAVVAGEVGGRLVTVASAGPASSTDGLALAARAMASGLVMAPVLGPGGIEAAAPVWYGGATIGVLAARWAVDRAVDRERVGRLLAAASAACAPRVRAVLDRRAAPAPAVAARPVLIGVSNAMALVREAAARAARVPFAVLIEGESGSGKERVAEAIHHASPRRDRRFCTLNCAALADELVEAELFGHARGAFTGAVAERPGLFEDAHQGTLLLDEVAELSPRAQAKLLRAIQDGEVRRVGENLPRRVDVRLIAATNRSLEGEVAAGRFRADLRYRLDVIRIVVPPLRERPEDIAPLAAHFWEQAVARTGSRATLAPETLAALARYDWPGNVRELQNTMAALAAAAGPRGRVGPRELGAVLGRALEGASSLTLDEARAAFERRFVRAALARAAGHRGRAARALGVSRQGLVKLLKRLAIDEGASPTHRAAAS